MKTSSRLVDVNILDLAVLLCNVFRAAQSSDIGYNDAEMSLRRLKKECWMTKRLPVELVEKLLYCSNMLDEDGKFWHHEGKSFEQFLKAFEVAYDREYGWVK